LPYQFNGYCNITGIHSISFWSYRVQFIMNSAASST